MLNDLKPTKLHPYEHSEEEIAMWKHLREKYLGLYEGEVAYEIFKDEYPELAVALRNNGVPRKVDKTKEEMLVHYADWRISLQKIVTLQERLKYLQEVYQKEAEEWEEDELLVLEYEEKLMKTINLDPEKLAEAIKRSN